jgi:hypothetical protein
VVLEGGNVQRAATALKRMGTPIPRRTIADWRRNEAALYAEVQRERERERERFFPSSTPA